VIAEWRDCVDCGSEFGLTPKQCSCTLVAPVERCPPCRRERKRCLAKARAHKARQTVRHAGTAPTHANHSPEPLTGASSHA
jgi:hypothetical protein